MAVLTRTRWSDMILSGTIERMSEEQWKPVVGFEGLYEVSDHGRVRSLPRRTRISNGRTRLLAGREMKLLRHYKSGHLHLNLFPLQGRKGVRRVCVNWLVLEAFVGPRPEGLFSCHNDGNPANNHVSNLRWDTPSSNVRDTINHGNHHMAKRELCNHGHPLDGIYTWPDGSWKQRYCRTCAQKRARVHYEKKRAKLMGKLAA